jgi:hypothetical protein
MKHLQKANKYVPSQMSGIMRFLSRDDYMFDTKPGVRQHSRFSFFYIFVRFYGYPVIHISPAYATASAGKTGHWTAIRWPTFFILLSLLSSSLRFRT